ncbi:telomerase ribonucleoprotein complex - RNA binding domain-containing protein [Hirsutella rhossiliensis]
MTRGVKRKRGEHDSVDRQLLGSSAHVPPVHRDLLQQCYPKVRTLRDHAISKLPGGSRLRRRKIASLGSGKDCSDAEMTLAHVLDTTLICSSESPPRSDGSAYQQFLSFSQQGDESYVSLSDGIAASTEAQSEIVDFVIWLLFQWEVRASTRPKHLLCDGFRRGAREGDLGGLKIPGIYSLHPNPHAAALKQAPWPHLLLLLGQSGQRLMVDLLMDCSIFLALEAGSGNYYQLSGSPLSELDLSNRSLTSRHESHAVARRISDIAIMRRHIFYAKPELTALGRAQPGYRRTHILNRCPHVRQSPQPQDGSFVSQLDAENHNEVSTRKVMMYIFPRQFGLHNVFTSKVDTAQRLGDYMSREEEIATLIPQGNNSGGVPPPKLPRRLRGAARHLVRRLQILHGRCSYAKTLRHYCPTHLDKCTKPKQEGSRQDVANGSTTNCSTPMRTSLPSKQTPLVDLACPASCVSAFCQAVLSKIIPNEFWGDGETLCHNKAAFLHKVHHFIKLRRFESMTLHEISQGFKVADLAWLRPPGHDDQKLGQSDINKRREIFYEFLHYIFDSLLIPLIQSSFYVTESNTHRYEVFYFRHDVWRLIAKSTMAELRGNMFEEMKLDEAQRILDSRRLGYGQLRLLPKGNNVRLITNLRRRNPSKVSPRALEPSINSVLGPIHTILKFEKDANLRRLGSSLYSVGDVYQRLRLFKDSLGPGQRRFYCAKVDVHAAFDTIPQGAVVKLMSGVLNRRLYTVTKHAEVQPGERAMPEPRKTATSIRKRWCATAVADGHHRPLLELLEGKLAGCKKDTVFVESVAQKAYNSGFLVDLLSEHVECNLVKFGSHFFRQKRGVPQGSVLSSWLCNYFYADLESRHLGFLQAPDCLLMRLIDDFLLITLDKSKAVEFVQNMHRGFPDYGVEANQKKTRVNFDMHIGDDAVSKVSGGGGFPYCGLLINDQSLGITKDRIRSDGTTVSSSLTVEFGRSPGQNFQRKVLAAFKAQSHFMFYDSSHNNKAAVLHSLSDAFSETCRRMWAYIRCLSRPQRPRIGLVIQTIVKVADVAFVILSSKSRRLRYSHYSFGIRKGQVSGIAFAAFLEVLSRKQTGYGPVISWLQKQQTKTST